MPLSPNGGFIYKNIGYMQELHLRNVSGSRGNDSFHQMILVMECLNSYNSNDFVPHSMDYIQESFFYIALNSKFLMLVKN